MAKRKAAPKKDGPHKLRPDVAETAFRVMQEATGEKPKTRPSEGEKNPVAVSRGRRGGAKGGRAGSGLKAKDGRGGHLREQQRHLLVGGVEGPVVHH